MLDFMAFVGHVGTCVSRGVPEEDALLLAEEVRHQAEHADVARNLAGRLPPSTLPDASLTLLASMDEHLPRV
jgi:hypothetical protein